MHNKSKKRDAKNSIEFFHILYFYCAEIRHNMSFMKCYRGEDV